MLPSDILNELLFFNRQTSQPAASSATTNKACAIAAFLIPQQKPLKLSAGITTVAHLQLSLQFQQPQLLASEWNSVLLALPSAWRAVVSSAPASTWCQVLSASGRELIQDVQTGQLHTISSHLQLHQTPPEPVSNPISVQVVSWDPCRPWSGPSTSQLSKAVLSFKVGCGARIICHLRCGVVAVSQLISWWSDGSSDLLPPSTHWPSSDMSASLPAWMTPSQTPRLHWSDRQQQRQEQHQQQMQQQPAPQLPLDRSASDDTIDVLEACGSHPQQAQWRHLWELAAASYLGRQHRVLWWRLLHSSLMCGAYRAYIGRAMPAQANCPFSCCINRSRPRTISHLFITCPVAATVTDWLCRLWQAMTGYLPVVSAASLLAADTPKPKLKPCWDPSPLTSLSRLPKPA